MALGKELGMFDLSLTSITLGPGKKTSVSVSANFEGTVKGKMEGDVVATMTIDSPDGKDGKYKVFTRTLFEDGTIQDAKGRGKTTHTGKHKWLAAGVADASNDRSYAIKGEIDFPERRFIGKMYDRGSEEKGS